MSASLGGCPSGGAHAWIVVFFRWPAAYDAIVCAGLNKSGIHGPLTSNDGAPARRVLRQQDVEHPMPVLPEVAVISGPERFAQGGWERIPVMIMRLQPSDEVVLPIAPLVLMIY